MENKHIIHIISEIVVLFGITFYFNQQNQKLKSYIEDLAQRMEEQEDALKRQEEIIKSLASLVNNISTRQPPPIQNYQPNPHKTVQIHEPTVSVKDHEHTRIHNHVQQKNSKQKVRVKPQVIVEEQIQEISPPIIITEELGNNHVGKKEFNSDSEMDTDDELREELKELADDDEKDDLKKQEL